MVRDVLRSGAGSSFGRSTTRWRDKAHLGRTYNILELNLPCGLTATRGVCLSRVCEASVLPLSRQLRTDGSVRPCSEHPSAYSFSLSVDSGSRSSSSREGGK